MRGVIAGRRYGRANSDHLEKKTEHNSINGSRFPGSTPRVCMLLQPEANVYIFYVFFLLFFLVFCIVFFILFTVRLVLLSSRTLTVSTSDVLPW